ncbi:1-deoxy-D-xylulose-5-phosphate reductoisomerase [Salipaludibacillus agaradhaerens]|uniref:1-deoxy-D-xylulose-5-phosphate reductoisomerase n=1 Tax=Salipaludibacillus agaradhaerens TaxID=76935 RepID=UPI0021515E4E|nr:1-deoxy-D-xylulose-5-phosphate reductoisomerase [Salipaludibacillus agaradhaerens]MCR6107034.1 1-deoxy-D-xylulose-5-phosphate reductoisomerase [Salipaludibacillus agaradhaerens]MCR6119065.1 1-deoxy-D-xylulose-5-phosphate reductoisomerase [Salipaludibacillus agaradhaerens]UJW58116.1 1-deoxy-D-xylulose-5-phosphate reductoisomerase [Bacillus sp. A116_S68]
MRKINLIGSTGSIGVQTLDVMRSHPEEFNLEALSFGSNFKVGIEQIEEFKPKLISVQSEAVAQDVKEHISYKADIMHGLEGLTEAAVYGEADILVNAVMGRVGLEPTIKAIQSGKDVAIANKETLVMAGNIVTALSEKYGTRLIPVDSEHSAIAQCLHGNKEKEVSKLILTASGGSFRDLAREELKHVTVKEALNHPNWSMGAKITIDSATMMNKGLEVIEAKWLFDMAYDDIDVLLHKESIIHSMVEYIDGSILAHLGTPDMRVPIQYALSEPNRLDLKGGDRLKLWEVGTLHFEKMDYDRFRCLKMAFEAGRAGGIAPAVLNAANEVAVSLFLEGRISFLDIEVFVEKALHRHTPISNPSLEDIVSADKEVRSDVLSYLS